MSDQSLSDRISAAVSSFEAPAAVPPAATEPSPEPAAEPAQAADPAAEPAAEPEPEPAAEPKTAAERRAARKALAARAAEVERLESHLQQRWAGGLAAIAAGDVDGIDKFIADVAKVRGVPARSIRELAAAAPAAPPATASNEAARVRAALGDHPALALPGAVGALRSILEESRDRNGAPTLTLRQAADRLAAATKPAAKPAAPAAAPAPKPRVAARPAAAPEPPTLKPSDPGYFAAKAREAARIWETAQVGGRK